MSGVLETVGVAVAVPGVIDVIVRGGEVVYEKIDDFRKIDQTMISFRETALDLKEGTLYFALHAIKAASQDRLIPISINDQLDRVLDSLEKELNVTQSILDSVHEDTIKGKLVYTFWRGKGSKHQLDGQYQVLKTSCDKLKDLCLQLHNYQTAQSSLLLTSDIFKVVHETLDNRPGDLLPNSDIFIASGNYIQRDHRVAAEFILEKRTRENDVRYICSRLNKEDLTKTYGILPTLGYRQQPYNDPDGSKYFQLVFELPEDTTRDSLAHCICSKPKPELVGRLRLCLDLALGVKSVHDLGLVHKSLRPRSTLILSNTRTKPPSQKLFLQNWTYVREFEGATTQLGESSWQKKIYQHPSRQGKYADAAYEPKHDIYSLGVCFLEILLWSPFIVWRRQKMTAPTSTRPENSICEMFETYGLRRGEANGGLPQRYKGDSVKLTSKSWLTKAIWMDIASNELDNDELSKLVLDCLKGNIQDAQEVISSIESIIEVCGP